MGLDPLWKGICNLLESHIRSVWLRLYSTTALCTGLFELTIYALVDQLSIPTLVLSVVHALHKTYRIIPNLDT